MNFTLGDWALAGASTLVSLIVLRFGFFIHEDLRFFYLFATLAIVGGYQVGLLFGRKERRIKPKIVAIVLALVICIASALAYSVMTQMGSANLTHIAGLAALITIMFFSLGFFIFLTKDAIKYFKQQSVPR